MEEKETMMKNLHCVVHYKLPSVSPLLPLDDHKFQVLLTNRKAREKLGGANGHVEQCASIPESFTPTIHGAHTGCYNKFTKAVSILRKKKISLDEEDMPNDAKRTRRSGEGSTVLFPDYCMFCKKKERIQVNYKKQEVHVIEVAGADEKIQEAAKTSNDVEMQRLVDDGKLYEREFRCHNKCYKDYTRCLYTPTVNKNDDEDPFDNVEEFIKKYIVTENQAVSITKLSELMGHDKNDRKKRERLKEKILKAFPDLLFLSSSSNTPQIVVSSLDNITSRNFQTVQREDTLKIAALELRKELQSVIENAPSLPWPPTSDDLLANEREAPESVRNFLRCIIQNDHHKMSDSTEKYVWSLSQDLLHIVSRGSFLTAKHVLLSSAIHTMTGQKVPINILSSLGNCSSYESTLKIETAQAELNEYLADINAPLPVIPKSPGKPVLTHFWWDNFDCTKENAHGSVHTTHGVAFQEISSDTAFNENIHIIPSGRKSLKVVDRVIPKISINPKIPPQPFSSKEMEHTVSSKDSFTKIITLWKLARRIFNGDHQLIPRFVGRVIEAFQTQDAKTVLTFLPPINRPITEYSTVCETINRSIRLAEYSNMIYTHITVDIGAAEKYYKVIWNNPTEFEKVIIHLGDFHGMMHFFGNVGKYVSSSGFEDTVYQACICSEGAIKKVLSGKAYNSCWRIHEIYAEAIDRLFEKEYVIPAIKNNKILEQEIKKNIDNQDESLKGKQFMKYYELHLELKERALKGEFGITPQFWMKYQEMVELIHQLHFAINLNDFDLRLSAWEQLIPLSFAMNKQNYARYGTFYILQMRSLDPDARSEIERKGLSVCRNNFGIRQSIDGSGEQTFMRSSKTAGGIKNSVTQNSTYHRWVMSRPGQAKYLMALKDKVGVSQGTSMRKCLRPSEIRKHEKCVEKVMDILEKDFLNPFSLDLEPNQLYNLSSGKTTPIEVQSCLISVFERGNKRMEDFKQVLCFNEKDVNIFTPIKKEPWKSFEDTKVKGKVNIDGKVKEITLQRDILGVLAAKSAEEKTSVDIDDALKFPLAPVSLSLSCADGGMRKTNKSKLFDVLELEEDGSGRISNTNNIYFIDLAATMRAIVNVPNTFEELAMRVIKDVPEIYRSVYVACDTYPELSIKNAERKNRGESDKILLKSSNMKIPRDFQRFLDNGNNKTRLFELFEETYITRKKDLLDRNVYIARESSLTVITESGANILVSMNHEEADTKLVSLVRRAIENTDESDTKYLVRSSSGDIDIPVIFLSSNLTGDIVIDNGRSNSRKMLHLKHCKLSQMQKKALIGFHAFTGCDQNSSFFRKGKKNSWKKAQNYLESFSQLGESYDVPNELYIDLEAFVCHLYGGKGNNVDKLRSEIFWKTLRTKDRVIELSLLPPCRKSLNLHIKRSNYISRIWRQAEFDMMVMENPSDHGWNDDLSLRWPSQFLPDCLVTDVDVSQDNVTECDFDTDSEDELGSDDASSDIEE